MTQNFQILNAIFAFFSLAVSLFCLWRLLKMRKWQKAFFQGKSGADLESAILHLEQQIKNLESESLLASTEIRNLQTALSFTVQKVGLVRYNPFAERQGGNYSFSLALLDAHNSGIIITNMYGRQQSRVYTKKLEAGKSEMPLTEEEAHAINLANQNNNSPPH